MAKARYSPKTFAHFVQAPLHAICAGDLKPTLRHAVAAALKMKKARPWLAVPRADG
jgi:hypothetical protein